VVLVELFDRTPEDREVIPLGELARSRIGEPRLFMLGLWFRRLVGKRALGVVFVRVGVSLATVSVQQLHCKSSLPAVSKT
jgi:hypothetical protein